MNSNFASDNLEDKAVRHFLHATTLRRRFAVRGLPDAFASGPAESLSADVISTGWKTRSVFFHGMETSLHRQSFPEDNISLESAGNAAGMGLAFPEATAFLSHVRPGRGTLFLSPSVRAAENVNHLNRQTS